MTLRQFFNKNRFALAVAVLAACAIAVILIVNRRSGSAPDGSASSQSATTQASNPKVPILCAQQIKLQTNYAVQTFFTAEVVPSRATDLSFQRAGRVIEVLVDDGSEVSLGQVIAKLDHRHLDAQKNQLDAELAQATSILAELKAGPRKETIEAARAQVNDVQQQLLREEKQLERSTQLLEQTAISQQQHERTLFGVRALQAKLDSATSQLDELLAGTRQEQIDAQQARLSSIKASLESLKYDLQDCQIEAPFAGLVSRRTLDEGAIVSPGSIVCHLIENRSLEIHVGLPIDTSSGLSVGDKVDLLLDDIEQSLSNEQNQGKAKATVSTIINQLDSQTRTIKVVLTVDPLKHQNVSTLARPRVVAGQSVRIGFETEHEAAGFWLPVNALISDHRGLWSCFVFKSTGSNPIDINSNSAGIARRQSVEVLHEIDGRAFVRGTLNDGDWLICEGLHRLADRQRIQIKQTDPTPTTTQTSLLAPQIQDR